MAQLKSLLVMGGARFLNKIYATDLELSGSLETSGLTVNGNFAVTGEANLRAGAAKTPSLSINSKGVLYGYDGWLRINEENKFASGVYFGTNLVRTDGSIQVGASGSKINMRTAYARFNVPIYMNNSGNTYKWTTDGNIVVNNVNATTATLGATTITNGKATTLDVSTLNVTHQNIEHVANLGGTFLVTPTVKCISSGSNPTLTSFSVATTSASRKNSENVNVTYNYKLTIADTAFTTATIGTITWTQYSEVKVSGTIDGTVLGTCNGYIESIETGDTHRVVINIKYDGTGSLSTPSDITTVDGLTIMLTNIWVNGTEYDPIGIWMKSADSDGRSHISLYGGTTTDPVVRIGNLAGLPKVNGKSPEGWGIYTNHGYFDGVIVSNYGKIGNFTITDALYSIAKSFGSTADNVYIGDDGISLGTTFKVTKAGAMTSTSGNIAAFQIDATALHTANVAITSNADNSIALSHADFTRTVAGASRTGLRFAIGDKFGVTGDGVLYGSDVNLTGAINATSGTIGSNATYGNRWQIGDRAIYYGNATPGNSASTLVISTGTASTKSIGGSDTTSKNWMLAAGTGFGVTTAGVLYATGAHINGAITATSLTLSQGVTIGQDKIDGLTDDLSNALSKSGWYGTCSTTASQQIKDVTVSDDGFDLKPGTALTVYFTTANTVTNPKLRINNGESKSIIAWGNVTAASDTPLLWGSISHITFIYDGSYWMIENESRSYSATCSTAETTQTKAPSLNEVVITNGTTVTVHFSKANTYVAGPVKLNFAGTGAANIYVDDVVTSTTKTLLWDANTDLTFVRRGQYWYLVSRSDASKSATNYLTTITGTTGISVHDVGDTSNFVNMNSNGVFVYKGGIQRAQFGETTIIGKSYVSGASNNESHVEIDYRSLQLVDKENDVFFRARDFRDTNGIATMTDNFIGDGEKTSCTVRFDIESVIEVAINQTVTTAYTREGREFSFTTAPAEGFSVTIKYTTKSEVAKEYTLGLRSSNTTYGALSVAEGYYNTVSGHYSHGEGYRTMVTGDCSHAEGNTCYDENDDSILVYTTASGAGCHAEGSGTKASNTAAHSEGLGTVASGHSTHAEGYRTTASNSAAHSEGYKTIASGEGSHAEGIECIASANSTHAEGGETEASGNCSHAQNYKTKAIGIDSTAAGLGTLAKGAVETVIGMYNSPPENYDSNNRKWENPVFTIGNGSSDDERSNAFTVNWLGDVEMYMYVTIDPSTGKATSGTPTDLALRQAIEALGWVDDVIS